MDKDLDVAGGRLALLLDILSLALFRAFGDSLAEHSHELANATPGKARVAAKLTLCAELHRGSLAILEDLNRRRR